MLSFLGLLAVLSATINNHGWFYFSRQLMFLVLTVLVMAGISLINWRFFKNEGKTLFIFYCGVLALLAGLFFIGSEIRGARSWYRLGGIGFEPVEIAKIILVLVLAKYFSKRHVEIFRVRHVIVSFLYLAFPLGLVLLQPDLGSAIILLAIWLGLVLLAGIKARHLAVVIFLGCVFFLVAWSFLLADYQKQRIASFLDPERDPLGSSYNLLQSLISVGSGGFWGKGFGQGGQTQFGFLPESHSDFIFASLAEEWGFFGCFLTLALYAFFIVSLVLSSQKMPDNFSRLVILGFAIMFFVEITLNISMNIGLLPITGTPLPFLSYGGSNLLASFLALGVVLSLTRK